MRPIVLVHGSWLGGWSWRAVIEELRNGDAVVYGPSLTGLGERSRLARPEVGLRTHIADVAGLLRSEDLHDVVLVGHSYAGLVVGGAATIERGRVSALVFLAANLPANGRSLLDEWSPRGRAWLDDEVRTKGAGWLIPVPDDLRELAPDLDDATLVWARERLVPQPLRTFTEPLSFTEEILETMPHTFIHCSLDASKLPDSVQPERGWRIRTLDSGHWPMLSRAADLAHLLREVAEGGATAIRAG